MVLIQLLKNSGDWVLLYQLLINSPNLVPMFFELYYQRKIYAAIIQIMGRNRALRYLEEEFTVNIFCKDLDPGFLREAGYVDIHKKNIIEFGLDGVLSPHQQKIKALKLFLEGRFKARESLGKLSEVANLLGMAKGTLSKLIREVLALDWQSLSGRFQNLLSLFKENGNSQKVIGEEMVSLSGVEMKEGLISAFTQTPSEIVWWFGEFFQSKSQTEAVSELELALQLGVETFGVEVAMTMLGALSNLIFADYDGIFPDFQPETG